ncbi:MAG: transcription termination/antitermination protein NusG [Opitutaceae bacterium]
MNLAPVLDPADPAAARPDSLPPAREDSRLNWYCVHTKPRKEAQVAGYLEQDLGIETYFPRLRRQRTIRRVRRIVTGPLFPRYLFCRFELSARYAAVRYAPDALGVVSFGQAPAVVDDALVRSLRSWAGEEVDVITIEPGLRPGDRVSITDGPMRGLEAVILGERNDRERVAVMLSILERQVQLLIDRSQLARVEPSLPPPGPLPR